MVQQAGFFMFNWMSLSNVLITFVMIVICIYI
jgi:hypothetical protein